ncbi:MAG: hypothetical protein LBM39_02220 [Candidatus Methanoplasma sp.]|jgi:hypothetical protein|nr:hypothetical protein [Candidatus Methanoplasma sp.]
MTNVGQELLNVPFPEMVVKLASAIAEGQFKMDQISCEIAKNMGDAKKYPISLPDVTNKNEEIKTSLIGAGFQPTFYQFTDTIIEVKMAITMATSSEASIKTEAKGGFGCFSASVNASYSSKYSYEVSGSSLLRTRITPVPPSTFMQKLLEMKAQMIQQEFDLQIKKAELEIQKKQAEIAEKIEEENGKTTSNDDPPKDDPADSK